MNAVRLFHCGGGAIVLLCVATLAQGQAVSVPPSKRAEAGLSKETAATVQAMGQIADAKSTSLGGLGVVSLMTQDRKATRVLRGAGDAYGLASASLTLIDTVDAAMDGDEKRLADNAYSASASLAVTGGCAMTGMPYPCQAAYGVGNLVGQGINYAPKLLDPKNRTVNEVWTDEAVFPAWEALGCPGSQTVFGVESRYCGGENSQAVRDQAKERFDRSRAALEEKQRNVDAQRLAQQSHDTDPDAGAGSGWMDAFSGMLGTYAEYQQQNMSMPAPTSTPTSAPTDSSGCHIGHDETSHPGGCHDAAQAQR